MLTVGIHQNLLLTKATKNDQGTLVVGVAQKGDNDPVAALQGGGFSNLGTKDQDFLFYPPKVTNFDGQVDDWNNNMTKMADLRDQLVHIASQYMTSDKINLNALEGLGVNNDNIEAAFTDQSMMDKMYATLTDQFIKLITPHVNDKEKPTRWLFIRQSKTKHYPALRKKFLESYPFVESMQIPEDKSRLRFSKFEEERGLNHGTPVTTGDAPDQEEATKADKLYSED